MRLVLQGRPVLARPSTGVVFAFGNAAAVTAGASRLHTFSDGSSLNLSEIGPEWLFGMWFRGEPAWCRTAFEAARLSN
jgi:hypothetical protein